MIEFKDCTRSGTLSSCAFSAMTMGRRAESRLRGTEVLPEWKKDKRGARAGWWSAILAIVAGCCAFPASAVTIADDYAALLRERTEITRLDGDDMFGDSIGLYTGSIEFFHTDVSIPGNNSLEVGIKRRLNLTSPRGSIGFSDWELAIPNMHGVFSKYGWKGNDPDRSKRCTGFGEPPYERADPQSPNFPEMLISGREFWRGTFLYLPNAGDEEVLEAWPEHQKPSNGYVYALRTKGGAAVRCISMGSGTEEGFEVLTPDGITYRLNHMVSRSDDPLLKSILNPPPGFDGIYYLQRNEYFLYPTSASDRFGNTVTYTWSSTNPFQLTRISSSDGRAIDIIYYEDERKKNKIRYVKHASRTWEYMYENDAKLSRVTLPDTTSWTFETYSAWSGPTEDSRCGFEGTRAGNGPAVSMTHPSGAKAVFSMESTLHGRSSSAYSCSSSLPEYQNISYENYPAEYFMWSIKAKSITGPGIQSPLIWTYTYGPANGCYTNTDIGNIRCTGTSAKTKWLDVKDPSGVSTRYTFGNELNVNEGNLLSVVNPKQTTTNAYHWISPGPYPAAAGRSGQGRGFNFANRVITLREKKINRDGADFIWRANTYDVFARPLSVTKSSTITGNPVKTEVTAYHDDSGLWVLGQVANVKCAASVPVNAACDGDAVSQTTYGWMALPWKTYAFGKLQQQLGYDNTSTVISGQLGTIKQVIDGRGNTTTLTGWKRGIPGKITYPATTDQPTAVFKQAVVDEDGTIQSVTDENGAGFTTKYQYDPMGRVKLIDYPDGDTVNWNSTTRSFAPSATARLGIPAGHWVEIVSTGGGIKVVDYDALWRPLVEYSYTSVNGVASNFSIVVKRYDAAGRLEFQSYPVAALGAAGYADTTLKGTKYTYDALDRVTKAEQDWEGTGKLTTTTEYLTGFMTRVTNPRGKQTVTSYQAFDQPTYDFPRGINHPTDANTAASFTSIYRNILGNPYAIARYNADNSVRQTRWYVYDAHQQLCKTIDDETGATVMHYDGAGNLDWSGSGLNALASTTDCQHDHATVAARKVIRAYDARNRLKSLSFPNGVGNTSSTYTADGLLASIVANNGGQLVMTSYSYSKRRLLEMERMQWNSINWPVDYAYNTNGHLASQTFSGLLTDFAPDQLGRPTKAGTSASGVSYHPNGAIKQFTYGNGITHTMIPNARGLPDSSCDSYGACGATSVLNDGYDYDGNGNVAAISDGRTGNRGHRTMTYDALDRLTMVGSRMFGTTGAVTNAFYFYDVLDNLTRTKILDRDHYYCYDANRQLTFLRKGPVCTGSTPSEPVWTLGYDEQGNVKDKNNIGYDFDFGNRLRSVKVSGTPVSSYIYDGHGRRVRDFTTASKYSLYGNSGQLVFDSDGRKGLQHWYVYLQGSLVEIRERNTATGVYTTKYQHTDALGSSVAVTDANRNQITAEKSEYEPYGKVINRPNSDGPGYTGHVMDAATGLNYMQQRYYDPMIGRFLSVDPVAAGLGPNFNRYSYANNNPYRFVDPDGRMSLDEAASEEKRKQRQQVTELGANDPTVNSFQDLPKLPEGVHTPGKGLGRNVGEGWEKVERFTGNQGWQWTTDKRVAEIPIDAPVSIPGRASGPLGVVIGEAIKAALPDLIIRRETGRWILQYQTGYRHALQVSVDGVVQSTSDIQSGHGTVWTNQFSWRTAPGIEPLQQYRTDLEW